MAKWVSCVSALHAECEHGGCLRQMRGIIGRG
eukprot:CAMPEP_0183364716 /NCGR_PEP_ID=MMETSP0164_2-20130417/81548_1 /TAXON_ID=221442 /ORGANISM="Coccolithus pelagicus ssp braarudi, Strain PLY182g" /LENGTH=31 /DNA_ID= /DNA_START= /DNA_END= /DNA_ORIENTATION=